MPRITRTVAPVVSDEWFASQKDRLFHKDNYRSIIGRYSMDLRDEAGRLVLRLVKRALTADGYPPTLLNDLRAAARWSENRQLYTGTIGYYDHRTEGPSATAFTRKHVDKWLRIVPFVRAIDSVYRRRLPDEYEAQLAIAQTTDPEVVIADTAFTTGTVNRWTEDHNCRTPLHTDSHNLSGGMSVITVLRSGDFEGGYLILARYALAVDLEPGDVLFFRSSEPHANSPIIGQPGWERLSVVLYFRDSLRNL